jgi:uncharacterized protein (TIGR03032 family)
MSAEPRFEISASRLFTSWLIEQRASLAFTTYQAGKLFFIGVNEAGGFSVFNRTLERVMGIAAHGDTLWVSTLWQLWRFENALAPGERHQAFDRWYVPQLAYTTGDIDIHDIAVDAQGQPHCVATLFSCVVKPDERFSFRPVWKPPFISRLAAEDRCHLNGLTMRDGALGYATCVGRSDAHEGWREHRRSGGLVIDIARDEVIASGLSMPHSPRWYRDRLWLNNAGTGEFGYLELDSGRFVPVAFCPGFLRGLAFCGDYAIVGLSRQRQSRSFQDLDLDARLAEKNVSARCGLAVIDLKRGDVVHELRIEGEIGELFDVAVLPGARNPGAVGFRNDEIRRTVLLPPGVDGGAF